MSKKAPALAEAKPNGFTIYVDGMAVANVSDNYVSIDGSDMNAEEFEAFAKATIDALKTYAEE